MTYKVYGTENFDNFKELIGKSYKYVNGKE